MARRDPYAGFRFVVLVDQIQKGGFTKVRGLQRETRVESFREGGVNDFEHKLVTLTTYPNLVLERGLADPYLWNWHQQVVEGKVKRALITITLRDENRKDVWGWPVQDAFPVKWSVADFDAASGQVATETVEFAHHGLLLRPSGRERRGMKPRAPLRVGAPLRPVIGRRGRTGRRLRGPAPLACSGGGASLPGAAARRAFPHGKLVAQPQPLAKDRPWPSRAVATRSGREGAAGSGRAGGRGVAGGPAAL